MQDSIYLGKYSQPGTINVTSVQHVLALPTETLEYHRSSIEDSLTNSKFAQQIFTEGLLWERDNEHN
jgi:hypothetical protein